MHAFLAVVFMAVCGAVTAKWFALETGVDFPWKKAYRNRYFWLGVFVSLIFLYSDYRFAILFTS